jgi:hypothetical protein
MAKDNHFAGWQYPAIPNRSRGPNRPRDTNQIAKLVADLSTGEAEDAPDFEGKNPAAILLGQLGRWEGRPRKWPGLRRISAQKSPGQRLRRDGGRRSPLTTSPLGGMYDSRDCNH